MIIQRPISSVFSVAVTITLIALGESQAATYSVVANVSHAYSLSSGNPEILPTPNYRHRDGLSRIYQVDLYLSASNFSSANDQRGFGNITSTLTWTGGLSNSTMPGWRPNVATVDSHSPSGIVPLWAFNQDTGSADLQNILTSLALVPSPNVADPRPKVGQYPTLDPLNLLGSVYLNYNGLATETLTIALQQPSFAHISNGELELDPSPTLLNGSLIFGGIDPPVGDVNSDYVVNQLDLNVVFGGWLSTNAVLGLGDANGDGVVNQLDVNVITGNWLVGSTSFQGGLSASVPEPASTMLFAFAAAILLRRRRI